MWATPYLHLPGWTSQNEHMDGRGLDGSSFCSPIVKADNETDVALDCIIGRSSVLFDRLIFHILPGWGGEWAVSLPYLSAATATRCWWPRLVLRVFSLLVFVFNDEAGIAARAPHCRSQSLPPSKHFTPSIVRSPVALLLHAICITALSGVGDWAPFASTICDEFGIWRRSSEWRRIKWRELFGVIV